MLEKSRYMIRQKIEILEFFGIETRNKYQVLDEAGAPSLFVAEQGKTLLGTLGRQIFGHRQKLNLFVFNAAREKVLELRHPYSFFFQRVHVYNAEERLLGTCVHRFGIFRRRIDILDPSEARLLRMQSPVAIFLNWKYPVFQGDRKVAQVDKKYSGLLQELFTDADSFLVSFDDAALSTTLRSLILASAILMDLLFFEKKAERPAESSSEGADIWKGDGGGFSGGGASGSY